MNRVAAQLQQVLVARGNNHNAVAVQASVRQQLIQLALEVIHIIEKDKSLALRQVLRKQHVPCPGILSMSLCLDSLLDHKLHPAEQEQHCGTHRPCREKATSAVKLQGTAATAGFMRPLPHLLQHHAPLSQHR